MSQNFIRRLSERLVGHPDFQKRLEETVAEVLTEELREFAGQEVCFYVPKVTPSDRAERARKALAMLGLGMTPDQVAKEVGLSVRHVRRLRGTTSPLNMSA
jgi:hypothetical protein